MTTRSCPDNGTCHHGCEGRPCWRVQHCAPLSLAGFPGDQWPDDVKREHGVEVPVRCPYCGLEGREAMIPDGSGLPRVVRGMQYECGTTSIQQSHLCVKIEMRLQEFAP